MGVKVSKDLSKFAAILAQEAADLGEDVGKYVTSKLKSAGSSDADVSKVLKDLNLEAATPTTAPSKVSKMKEQGAPKKEAYQEPIGPKPGVLASSAGTPPTKQPATSGGVRSDEDELAAARAGITAFRASTQKKSPDFSEMGYIPDLRRGGPLTAEEVAQLEAKGGFSKTATEGADYEGGLAGLGQRPEAEMRGLGGQYEAPPRPVTETGLVPSGTVQSSTERYLADRQARQEAKEQFANRQVPPTPSGLSTGQKAAIGAAGTGTAVAGGLAALNNNPGAGDKELTEYERKTIDERIAQDRAAREMAGISAPTKDDETRIAQKTLAELRPERTYLQRDTDVLAQTPAQRSFLKNQYSLGEPTGPVVAKGTGKAPEGTEKTLAAKVAQTPSTVPVGGEGTKPSTTEPTTVATGKQEKKPTESTTSAMGSIAAALNKEQSSKKPNASAQTKQTTLDQLDKVAEEVNKDERFKYEPVRNDLVQLRAEAYKAYKEKADRNEWMDLAEKAINAIGQFASAKTAFGTPFAGGIPLSRTDYGAKTDQAFREYQAELGVIGEQAKAQERAGEKLETAKEKEIARRQRTVLERLEDERLQKKLASNEREAQIRYGSTAAAETRREARDTRAMGLSEVKDTISALDKQIAETQKAIQLGNRIGTGKSKDLDKELAEFASATKQLPEDIQAEIDTGTWKVGSPSTWGLPSERKSREQVLSTKVQGLLQGLRDLENQRTAAQAKASNLRKGLGLSTPVTATTPEVSPSAAPAPAGQLPTSVVVNGKTYARPAAFSDAQWSAYLKSQGK